MYETAGF